MKRAFRGFAMFLTTVSTLLASVVAAHTVSMTMQLHRLPHEIHLERYTRRLSAENDAPELVPLHLGLGTHYTWVYAGTPPQRASVIVDTGSHLMAFPCSGCIGCGNHTDTPFLADNSSTLVHVSCSQQQPFFKCNDCREMSNMCTISQSYVEGSTWKATVVEDVVYLGGESSFKDMTMRDKYGTFFQFGCQSSETGLFVTQVADGIMGLSNSENHLIAKLHRENKITSNLFSLCFIEDGGTMSVGQPHKLAHRGEISYAKLIPDRSEGHLYSVRMKDIRIGNKSINAKAEAFARGHFIVDSGTTDSYLPRSLKTEFLAIFKEVAGRDYQVGQQCKGYTNADLASLPPIQLVMEAYGDETGEVVLNVPPEQYLFRTSGAFCGSIYLSENHGGVIGANLMMNRDVIFDNTNQRVGFVDADCAYREAPDSAVLPSGSNKTTNISEGKEIGTGTIAVVPSATSAVPLSKSTPAVISSKPSTVTASTIEQTSEPALAPVTAEPATTVAATLLTTVVTNTSAPNAASSAADPKILSEKDTTTLRHSSSSAAMGDTKPKEKLSGTHPVVLTVVGAVLVVGFLLVMLISVRRRRQKTGKDQLWSRVKDDEEHEDDVDDDDEEEFGLVGSDKKRPSMERQRLDQEKNNGDDDHGSSSSSGEEDEIFDRHAMQEVSEVDNRTLERL